MRFVRRAQFMTWQARPEVRTGLFLALAAAFAAVLSIQLQGFQFPVNNNIFHVPIFERWSSEPAFEGDPFIGTLQYYVSGFWALMRAVPWQRHAAIVFEMFHYVARWATLLMIGCIGVSFGLSRYACAVLVAPVVCSSRSSSSAALLRIGRANCSSRTLPIPSCPCRSCFCRSCWRRSESGWPRLR